MSKWIFVKDEPMPDGESVLVYLERQNKGSRFTIHHSRKINSGYMKIIDGSFHFDFDIPIVAWRRMDDLEKEMEELMEEIRPTGE